MLRVVLVSSEITYVPDNYASAFETILEKCPHYSKLGQTYLLRLL
jgi:hypothetical protein